jgi:DNA adenine methylase
MYTKPFLKWAGGKGQLLAQFEKFYPEELKKGILTEYYEPFAGSAAVFFDIAPKYNIKTAYLFDINDDLILTYKVIRNNVEKLIDCLIEYSDNYLKLDKEKRSLFYYQIREEFNHNKVKFNYSKYNEKWIKRAAQIIFLNKTCFNGLFRVNSKGLFNTPVGDYDNPKICDENNLKNVSKLLEIAEVRKADFTDLPKIIKKQAFVYFDPPYRPISKTANFKSYSNSSFGDEKQKQLADIFIELSKKGHKVMLSNSDPKNYDPNDDFFDNLYTRFNNIRIERIPAKRLINSNPSKRGIINEIVVTNYHV